MAIVISGNGIEMGGNPISNASQIDGVVMNENGSNVRTENDSYSKTEVDSKIVGFKNYIINGGFNIWQRGTNGTIGYVADRWSYASNGAIQTKNNFYINGSYMEALTINETSGTGSPSLVQGIEGFNNMGGKVFTVSFWIYRDASTAGRNFNVILFKNSNAIFGYTIQAIAFQDDVPLSTWTKVTKTFNALPHNDTNNILSFAISMSGGTGMFHIAQVQLEEGSVATPFENRPYGLELSLCERYFKGSIEYIGSGIPNSFVTTSSVFGTVMRVIPTLSKSNANPGFGTVSAIYTSIYSLIFEGTGNSKGQLAITTALDAEL